MRALAAVGTTAILILMSEVSVCAAGAQDAIKSGKWELEGPKIAPGTQLPSNMRWGPEGAITSVCVPGTNLKPPDAHKRVDAISKIYGKGSCDMDMTTDATTGTRSALSNFAWSSGLTSRLEMVIHFHGDTLDGTTTNRVSLPNKPPDERLYVLKGRYVGPCDRK